MGGRPYLARQVNLPTAHGPPQVHVVSVVPPLDARQRHVGRDGGVVGLGALLDQEPGDVRLFGEATTYRNSFCSPFLARMPWVAVNRWPGTLIMGISALAGPSWGCSVRMSGVQGVREA